MEAAVHAAESVVVLVAMAAMEAQLACVVASGTAPLSVPGRTPAALSMPFHLSEGSHAFLEMVHPVPAMT